MTTIAFASDHAGYQLKQALIAHASAFGVDVLDLGTSNQDRVDYPDFGAALGTAVAQGKAQLGIGVCGSGIGIAMAAGKIPGIRAATVHDVTSARLSRQHNDANVMAIGQRFVGEQVALDAFDIFVSSNFEGGRHGGRVEKINALDNYEESQ